MHLTNAPGYDPVEQSNLALAALQNGFTGNADNARLVFNTSATNNYYPTFGYLSLSTAVSMEKGFVQTGEPLFSKDEKYRAVVLADASLAYEDTTGSIHQISAAIQKKESGNGWTFWHVRRNDALVCIDRLRQNYEETFLKTGEAVIPEDSETILAADREGS